ncbi:g7304 [Coccomyxa elongata]
MMLRGLTRLHYAYKVQAKQISTSAPKHSINQHLGGRKCSAFITQHSARRLFSDGQAPSLSSTTTSSTAVEGTFSQQPEEFMGPPKLVIFGGNGFVGSRVCEEALKTGLSVVSVNRSGPPKQSADWIKGVEWVKADVFDVGSWRDQLNGAVGVISCLGAFGSNDFMQKICGDSNITVFNEAAQAGVPRAAFISVHDYGFPSAVLPGYFQGKKRAEETLALRFPQGGVALRPGFIYGTRNIGGLGIPLGAIGYPLDKVLGVLPTKSLAGIPLVGAGFVPPVSARAVAKAAVTATTDPAVEAGILDVWQIKNYESP